MKHNENIILLDTETISLKKTYVYDFGYIVARYDEELNQLIPIEKKQFLTKQIWENKMFFSTAYFADKLGFYETIVRRNAGKGLKTVKHFGRIMQTLTSDIKKYNVEKWFAYNSPFDKGALDFTCEWYKLENPLNNLEMYDIQAISNPLHNNIEYVNFCTNNKFYGNSGYIQTSAEKTFAFLNDNPSYEEPHTSLQDCEIELDILNYCLNKNYQLNHRLTQKNKFIPSNEKQVKTIVLKSSKGNKEINIHYRKMINRKSKNIIEFVL